MNRIVRRRSEMAVRVRDFCRVHPSADGNYTLVLGQVEEKITRMQELARQEEGGIATSRASVARRRQLRRRLHHELLRHLVTVADVAAGELPGLSENSNCRRVTRATRRSGLTLASSWSRDRRTKTCCRSTDWQTSCWMTSRAPWMSSTRRWWSRTRRAGTMWAPARKLTSDDILQLVAMLDGLNRYRFAGNAELLAAWESAKNVVTGPRPAEEPPVEAPKAEGDVRPAA